MPLAPLMPWLMATFIGSIVVMLGAARSGTTILCALAAASFALVAGAIAIVANRVYWHATHWPAGAHEAATALQRNARLSAIVYTWGALAMQGLHMTWLTGLKWQHGWQYALVLTLFAFGAFLVARFAHWEARAVVASGNAARVAVTLAIGQGVLAAGGTVFMAGSGKLLSRKADWAANYVFLFGALAIMVVSAAALRTHRHLARD